MFFKFFMIHFVFFRVFREIRVRQLPFFPKKNTKFRISTFPEEEKNAKMES